MTTPQERGNAVLEGVLAMSGQATPDHPAPPVLSAEKVRRSLLAYVAKQKYQDRRQ